MRWPFSSKKTLRIAIYWNVPETKVRVAIDDPLAKRMWNLASFGFKDPEDARALAKRLKNAKFEIVDTTTE